MHTTCSDGCSYSFGGVTVTRTMSMSISNSVDESSLTSTQPSASTTVTSAYKFLDGAIGDFDIELFVSREETDGPLCKADFSGQSCTCDIKFCDIDQTTMGYTADCSHIPGGILYNSCHPSTFDDFTTMTYTIEDIPLMDRLISTPNLVCSAEAENIVEDGSRLIALDTSKFKPRATGGGRGNNSGGNSNGKSGRSYDDGDSSSFIIANSKISSITIFLLVYIFA